MRSWLAESHLSIQSWYNNGYDREFLIYFLLLVSSIYLVIWPLTIGAVLVNWHILLVLSAAWLTYEILSSFHNMSSEEWNPPSVNFYWSSLIA